jgi:hypothetical protein
MFITADRFWRLVEASALQAEKVKTLVGENAKLEATVEWMRTHINRLEEERALLLQTVYHAPVGRVEIDRQIRFEAPAVTGAPLTEEDPVQMLATSQALLEDVGDDVAARMGIKHNEDGSLKYEH